MEEFKNKTVVTSAWRNPVEKFSILVEKGLKMLPNGGGIWNYITQHPDKYWKEAFLF